MNSNSFFSSIYDEEDIELNGEEYGSDLLPNDTTNNLVDTFSMPQRYPLNNRTTFTPGRSIGRRATINTVSRWLQNEERHVYNSSDMMDDIDNNVNISTIDNDSSLLLKHDEDLYHGFGNRIQAQHQYQQQLYLERENQRLLGGRNMVSQSRLPLGRRPQSNHEPHSAQKQRRQELMQNQFRYGHQYLGSDHSTFTNARTISNSSHNYEDSSLPPEYPLAFSQDASNVNTFGNSSTRHQNLITSASLHTQFPSTHDAEIDDLVNLNQRETSGSLHDIYATGPRASDIPTSSFHNESVRSFNSFNDGTGHSNSQHYTYNRREPSSSSLNVVSFHSNASNNIGTGRRQFAPYQHQQQQAGLFFGNNRISDHENLYTMDASCHSISSFHSELNQLDVSQSDPIEALHTIDSSPSLYQRRNSLFRRFGPRSMQMSSNNSDHSSMAQISRHSTGAEGINATPLGHLRENYPHEDTFRGPAQDSRTFGDLSSHSLNWNHSHRSNGVRHLLNPSEQASSNTLPQIPQQQQRPLQSHLTKSASFSQHTEDQSEGNSTILPSSDHGYNRNRTQSACSRIFSIFTKDSTVSPAPTSKASRTSITTTSGPASPTNELDLNRRKRGRTKSNQNIEFMRRVPFRAPSLIGQQNNVPNAQQQKDAPADSKTFADINISNDDNEKDDQETPDRLEVNSLLHKSCKFYPETRVVIESALQLDFDAIRRPVPVMCVGTTTARRNSLGYVGPEILTCIQLMKGVTINDSGDEDYATKTALNQQSVDCYSYPINIALMSGAQLDVVEMLASAGSDVLTQPDGPEEANSLGIAVAHGCDIDVIRLLLETNIDTAQGSDRHYNLPLHVAVRSGTISNEILTTIHNAYPEAIGSKNFHGLNPLEVAIHSPLCTDSTVDLLQEMFNISLEADDLKFDDEQRQMNIL